MLATQQPQSGFSQSKPTLVARGGNGLPLIFSTNQGNSLFDTSKMPFDALRDTFGGLLGKPKDAVCAANAQTAEEFACHMDLYTAYKNRVWPVFGTMISAQLLNARNRFLPGIIAPILETNEMNFEVNQVSMSAMPFTEIAPCGIPEEPSGSYSYSWKQGVSEYAQGCTVNRDLITDPNFGAETWARMLQSFVANARLTIDLGIMVTLVQTGYENMSRDRTEGCPVNHDKMWRNRGRGFFSMTDPERALRLLNDIDMEIDGWDTLILPQGKIRYIIGISTDSQNMFIQKISLDPVSNGIISEFIRGPDSYRTIRSGNRDINVIEFVPFYIGDPGRDGKCGIRANPLLTNSTFGQFYPPTPFRKLGINCDDAACANINSIWIWNQTRTIGAQVEITLAERLTNAIYWDKETGKVSRIAKDFIRIQSQKSRSPEKHPWQWNEQNPKYDRSADINKDHASNSKANLAEVSGETSVKAMHYRELFPGASWDPVTQEFFEPERVGDFMLSAIPNEYIGLAAKRLDAKFFEKFGYRLDDGIRKAKRLANAIRNTPVTDDYLFALLDKNLPKMIVVSGTNAAPEYRLMPIRTPLIRPEKNSKSNKNPRDQCKFPEAELIEEAKSNRFGGWDLPDKPLDFHENYPPLMANGVGFMALAQEGLKQGLSLWYGAGKEAQEVISFAENFLKFLKEYVGKTDVINPRFMGPWIHKPNALAHLIDMIIGAAGPVHVGLPGSINYTNNLPIPVPTQKANLLPTQPILRATVADTRLGLEDAVRNNTQPRTQADNETRALACLSNDVFTKMRQISTSTLTTTSTINTLAGTNSEVKAALIAVLHQVYDYLINLCDQSGDATTHKTAVEGSSLIAEVFADKMLAFVVPLADTATLPTDADRDGYRTGTILKEMRAFANSLKSASAMKKILGDARKSKSLLCIDYGEGYLMALREYERPPVNGRPVTLTGGNGSLPASAPASIYRADYSRPPAKMIRAPLASQQSLRDYLRDKLSPWILPSDANLFYARPEEPRIVTSDVTIEVNPHKNKFQLCSLARSLVYRSRLCALKKNGGTSFASKAGSDKDSNAMDEDLFESLSAKKPVPTNMNKIFGLGKNWEEQEENDLPYSATMMKNKASRQYVSSETGEIEINDAMIEDGYRGPWKARLAYRAKELDSPALKFLFGALIQAKNRLDVFVRASEAGAVLLDVMIIRPFIEVTTSAMIALKAGADTMITTIGHSHVQVTKESRGCWHVDVGFIMGVIKIQPNNILLIPDAFPETLRGGKGVRWMTNFAEELGLPNPDKPDMIGLLISPDALEYASPLTINNSEPLVRPDTEYAIYQRKHSDGAWMEHVFGANTLANIEIASFGRETYAHCLSAANALSQGPASYINPATGCMVDVEGNGPMGAFNLNMPGVNNVYEGIAQHLPSRQEMYAYQNHCVQKK